MKKSDQLSFSWAEKAGLVFSILLLAAVTVVQGSTQIKSRAQGEDPSATSPLNYEERRENDEERREGDFKDWNFEDRDEKFNEENFEEREEGFDGNERNEDKRDFGGEGFHQAAPDDNERQEQDRGESGQDDERMQKDAERHLSQSRRDLDMRRKELQRNFRQSKVDTSVAGPALSQWENVLQGMQSCFENKDMSCFWDTQRDQEQDARQAVDDVFQSLYGQNQKSNNERMIKDSRRSLKDKERMIKDLEREKKDTSKLRDMMNQMTPLLDKAEGLQGQPDSDSEEVNDAFQEYGDLDREFWDAAQGFQQEREQENFSRMLKDAERSIKDRERVLKELERAKKETASLRDISNKMESLLQQIQGVMQSSDFDPQEANDLFRDYWDLNQDFWDQTRGFEQERQGDDMGRWLKDAERGLKHMDRFLEEIQREKPELAEKAKSLYGEMKKHWEMARAAYEGQDFEGVQEHLQEMEDARMEFEDAMQSFKDDRESQFFEKEADHMLREIQSAGETIRALLTKGKISQERADACLAYVDQGLAGIKKAKEAHASEDWETLESMKESMDGLGERAEKECGDLFGERFDKGADREAFQDVYVDKSNQALAKKVFNKVNGDFEKKMFENLKENPTAFNEILEKVGERFQKEVAQALEVTTFTPEEFQKDMLTRKTALLEQVKEMEALTLRLQELKKVAQAELQDLNSLHQQIANYNFMGNTGGEMEEEIERFMEGAESLDKTQVQKKIREFKAKAQQKFEEARKEKCEKGAIPFCDTDDDQWFTRYAAEAKREGWVKGTGESGFKELNPGGLTNVAETLTLFGRILGDCASGDPSSRVGTRMPDWARSCAAILEKSGVNLDAFFGGKQPGDAVTRAEVARLMQAALHLPAGDSSHFADIDSASTAEKEAIGAVFGAGMMAGEGDGTFFNVKGSLNRAAMVKVLFKVKEQMESANR